MKDDNCIFCKLANGDIPTNTIYEDADFRVQRKLLHTKKKCWDVTVTMCFRITEKQQDRPYFISICI